jgi:nitrous oxidase accessory protein NosD
VHGVFTECDVSNAGILFLYVHSSQYHQNIDNESLISLIINKKKKQFNQKTFKTAKVKITNS